jgi:hypothetical protein
MDFTTPEHILELCWDIAELSNWQTIPDPREVALMDTNYLSDLFNWGKLMRFERDYEKRPAFLRESSTNGGKGLFEGMNHDPTRT